MSGDAAPPPQSFDPAAFIERLGGRTHNAFIGMRHVAHGADWAELAFDHDPKLVGDPASGILASGPIISLMDMTSGLSIWLASARYEPIVTIDLRLDYLRPARPGRGVHARAQCYRLTRSVAFVRGQAHDGDPDDPLAHVAGTFMSPGGYR